MGHKPPLKGIIPALTTPFEAHGAVALGRMRENIGAYNRTGLSGYLAFGSTGESVLLDRAEFESVLAAVREAAAPGRILIAGTGAESTAETISRTEVAAKLGYDYALVCPPTYFKPAMTSHVLDRTLPARGRRRADSHPAVFRAAIHGRGHRSGCRGSPLGASQRRGNEGQFRKCGPRRRDSCRRAREVRAAYRGFHDCLSIHDGRSKGRDSGSGGFSAGTLRGALRCDRCARRAESRSNCSAASSRRQLGSSARWELRE